MIRFNSSLFFCFPIVVSKNSDVRASLSHSLRFSWGVDWGLLHAWIMLHGPRSSGSDKERESKTPDSQLENSSSEIDILVGCCGRVWKVHHSIKGEGWKSQDGTLFFVLFHFSIFHIYLLRVQISPPSFFLSDPSSSSIISDSAVVIAAAAVDSKAFSTSSCSRRR